MKKSLKHNLGVIMRRFKYVVFLLIGVAFTSIFFINATFDGLVPVYTLRCSSADDYIEKAGTTGAVFRNDFGDSKDLAEFASSELALGEHSQIIFNEFGQSSSGFLRITGPSNHPYPWLTIAKDPNGLYHVYKRESAENSAIELFSIQNLKRIKIDFEKGNAHSLTLHFLADDNSETELDNIHLTDFFQDRRIRIVWGVLPGKKLSVNNFRVLSSKTFTPYAAIINHPLLRQLVPQQLSIGALFYEKNNMNHQGYCAAMENFNAVTLDDTTMAYFTNKTGRNEVVKRPSFIIDPETKEQMAILELNNTSIERFRSKIDHAKRRGKKIHFSHLTWGNQVPDWLWNGNGTGFDIGKRSTKLFTSEEYEAILHAYVKKIVGEYKKDVDVWSIANEFSSAWVQFNRNEACQKLFQKDSSAHANCADWSNFWLWQINPETRSNGTQTGIFIKDVKKSYVYKIFKWTRLELLNTKKEDGTPSPIHATLMLNDYGNEVLKARNTKGLIPPAISGLSRASEMQYKLVKAINDEWRSDPDNHDPQSKLIDAIGLQMHIDAAAPPVYKDIFNTINLFADNLNVKVHISEIDVDLSKISNKPDKFTIQSQIYLGVLHACLNAGIQKCNAYTTWGISDNEPNHPVKSSPLIFDADYSEKPAYMSISKELRHHNYTKRFHSFDEGEDRNF